MHEFFMKTALALARHGTGFVHPNPLVGAVLVKHGNKIGQGYHANFGGPHAEVVAIRNAKKNGFTDLSESTLYVTLEPCCHFGKTPPCTKLIIESGIRNVIIGMEDPNPFVAGQGTAELRANGVNVTTGILEKECRALNVVFIKYITTKTPYVLLKSACSLDGKIATVGGESKWISCEQSREDVQRLRSQFAAIMCGLNTVRLDDPMLTSRLMQGQNPIRIITDSKLSIPLTSKIVQTAKDIPTIIATCSTKASKELEDKSITIIRTPPDQGLVNLKLLMQELGQRNIDSILLEGGGTLAFSALKAGIVDRIRYYVAPLLIGGQMAPAIIGGEGFPTLNDSLRLSFLEARPCGCDVIIEADVCSQE